MTKQFANLALRSAISAKRAANQLEIWHALDIGSHRTAAIVAIMKKADWQSVLFVDAHVDPADPTFTFVRVISNLQNAHLTTVGQLNVFDILKRDILVLSRRAAERLNMSLAPRFALPPIHQQQQQQQQQTLQQ
jgi:large subunit ribosomal protein L4